MTEYSSLNPEWLVMGKGEMLRDIAISEEKNSPSQNDAVVFLLKEQLQEAKNEIKELNREIGVLQAQKEQFNPQTGGVDQEECHIIIQEPESKQQSTSFISRSTDVASAGVH